MKSYLLAAAAIVAGIGSTAAQGGGSLGLDEVLEAAKSDTKLTAEINDELKKSNLKAADVICTGFRHDNRWDELSGARAAPYRCDIGKRTLVVEADRSYFDAKGKPLGDMKKANRKRAETFKEANFRWTWKALSPGKSVK